MKISTGGTAKHSAHTLPGICTDLGLKLSIDSSKNWRYDIFRLDIKIEIDFCYIKQKFPRVDTEDNRYGFPFIYSLSAVVSTYWSHQILM